METKFAYFDGEVPLFRAYLDYTVFEPPFDKPPATQVDDNIITTQFNGRSISCSGDTQSF